jgi:hypothetical protein
MVNGSALDDNFLIRGTVPATDVQVNGNGGNDVFNVSSDAPTGSGTVDSIQGPLTIQDSGAATLNVSDIGSTADKTGTLTPTTLTGLGMAGITYTGLGHLNVDLGSGNDTFAINDINPTTVTLVDGGLGTNTVAATFVQDFQGDLTLVDFQNASVGVARDFAGSLTARMPGDLQVVAIGGSMTSTGVLQATGTLDQLVVGTVVNNQAVPGNIAGRIHVGNLGLGYVLGSVSGNVQIDGDVTTLMEVFGDLSGTFHVGGSVAEFSVLGSQSGLLDVGRDITLLEIGSALTRSGTVQVGGDLASLLVSQGLAGQVIVVGSLDQARIYDGMAGTIAVQGDLGSALSAQGDQVSRTGYLLVTGVFSGQLVVMGNLLADVWLKSDLTGRIAVQGRAIPGLDDPLHVGILGNLQIDGVIGATGAIVSGGLLGDDATGTNLTAGGIRGLVAARGAIVLGPVADPDLSAATILANAAGSDGAAIGAIFTDRGNPLFIDPSAPGRANLALIVGHLAALSVDNNGHLTGGS